MWTTARQIDYLVNAVVCKVHGGLVDVSGRRRLVLLRADANLILVTRKRRGADSKRVLTRSPSK